MQFHEYGADQKETILLIHGGGLSWWSYREAAKKLQREYHVILPILDGHALSDRPFTTIEDDASEIISFVDERLGGSVLLIGGLSLGGQILLEMLSQRADLCSYALVESAAVLPSRLTNALIAPAFGSSYGLIRNRAFSRLQFQSLHIKPELFEDYYRDTCRIKKQDMIAFMKANTSYALKGSFRDTAAMVHVYVGKKETREILRSAEAICRALPSSRLHCLPELQASCEMSYARASEYVTDGQVSRQTVMNKIRSANPRREPVKRREVPQLHIDADEDHVHLQDGKSTIVPLVSVYEGIEHQGKRGICKNVFHISEYGKSPSELWEQVSDEIDRLYDLSHTRIYLHGDGASWIKEGLDYLPNCEFVLDRYHKNKAIKQALSGIERLAGGQYEFQIRKALNDGDRDRLLSIRDTLLSRYPERKETIRDNIDYLLNNFDAITITKRDEAALNGGCTEPHVSHILSARLSSRPMGWSKETLRQFVPILAAGAATFDQVDTQQKCYPSASVFLRTTTKRFLPNTAGLADPDHAVTFPARSNKITPLFNALRSF